MIKIGDKVYVYYVGDQADEPSELGTITSYFFGLIHITTETGKEVAINPNCSMFGYLIKLESEE